MWYKLLDSLPASLVPQTYAVTVAWKAQETSYSLGKYITSESSSQIY